MSTVFGKISIIGIMLALIFWPLDAGIDTFVFKQGTFIGQLLNPEKREIYIRFVIGFFFIFFGLYVQSVNNRLEKRNAEIAEAHKKLKTYIEELEKINNLAIGRELTMVELKEKIKAQEKRLKVLESEEQSNKEV